MDDMTQYPDFQFTYYTRRWNAPVTLKFVKTEAGWHISHVAINGDAKPDGSPFLEANLNQDYVDYPKRLDNFVEHVWKQLHAGEIDSVRAQTMLDELGAWVSRCEQSQPEWKGWNVAG
ncbi:MAG TPA: hypothetical protein VGD21_16635 [Lysobacter sp.]